MKIESIDSPSQPTPPAGTKAAVHMSPRERAIQALMKPVNAEQAAAQAQSMPVQNPTRVSPEEASAVGLKSAPKQIYNSEESSSSPQEAPAAPAASEEPLSSQYAVLARREKAIRQREQQLKAKEAALKPQEPPKPAAPTFDESKYVSKDRLTQDPFVVLNELGLDYEKLTDLVVNAPKPEQMQMMNEMRLLKQEIAALRGETEGTKKSFEDSQKQQYDQAITSMTNEARVLIDRDPQFETIKATGSLKDVIGLIERTFNEDGVLMSVEDAAQEVENYLVDEAIRLAKIKKIQQRLAPKPEAPKATDPKQSQLKTLTNSVSSNRQLSAKERAILAFQGKLNQQ